MKWLVAALWLFTPAAAFACATCTDPKEASRGAFLGTTVFLTLLPLAMIGGIAGFFWWKMRTAASAAPVASVLPFVPASTPKQ